MKDHQWLEWAQQLQAIARALKNEVEIQTTYVVAEPQP
jgi:hypothetical protein